MAEGAFRAAVAYENLADLPSTFVRATSSAPFLPVQMLRDPHIGRKWRGMSASESLFIDLGSPAPIDTVALVGCNVTGTTRLRGSLADSEAIAGTVIDTTNTGGDLRYRYQIMLLPEPVSVRYLRIDLDGAPDPIEAGRLVIGQRHSFRVNFGYGWDFRWVDPSKKVKSAGGSLHVEKKRPYRVLNLPFEFIDPETRWGFVEDLDARVGASADVLLLSHPLEPNFGQRAIWGFLPETTPNVESFFQNFSKTYTIEERL
ncbi:hypothetical protein [Aureimonas ureilytica]|uniref:hypothetical protein n=1 Tax=Aureimonas ureilytica TaxID=401562 RepID=UPI00035D423B|nr:hypothetical protein [Aureimonas ureilytica]